MSGRQRFWEDIHPLFTNRDLTRSDLRQLIRRGLSATGGNYRAVVQLFGMDPQDYKKLLNFLAAHECVLDYREFRRGAQPAQPEPFGQEHARAEKSKALAG